MKDTRHCGGSLPHEPHIYASGQAAPTRCPGESALHDSTIARAVRACELCGGTTYHRLCGLCARIMVGIRTNPDNCRTFALDRRYR